MIEWYVERLKKVHSIQEMNDIIEEAANNEMLMNEEYQEIYREGILLVMG